jgi:hypothetical protein
MNCLNRLAMIFHRDRGACDAADGSEEHKLTETGERFSCKKRVIMLSICGKECYA